MNIILALTGGIACYKSLSLASNFIKEGHQVQVVLTEHATNFVTPLSFEALTGRKVITEMFAEYQQDPVAHIHLTDWADVMVVAPATANILSKMANGLADDFLSTLYLAWDGPTFIAPAMNSRMYEHLAVKNNLQILSQRGVFMLKPGTGRLACGTVGMGKMMEPEDILKCIRDYFEQENNISKYNLQGRSILVSAGPTQEAIDPVRCITNHSSGKMGYAIAAALKKHGANVTLVSGPCHLASPEGVRVIAVTSTADMFQTLTEHYDDADGVIMAAAPSDYRPVAYSEQKIKKKNQEGDTLTLTFEQNPDILKWLGRHKKHQVLIGFAAESEKLIKHATKKLQEKNLDLIVVNDITAVDAGFHHDVNTVQLIHRDESVELLPTMSKDAVAEFIVQKLSELLEEN